MQTFISTYAFLLVLALTLTAGPQAQAKSFEVRGIKGLFWDGIRFYQEALPWLARHHMNFLMTCYTSFPASATEWRSDYTPAEMGQLRDLAAESRKLGVNLCLSFNPAIWSSPPLLYSSEQDYTTALNKVKKAHALGITWFALCLDDIDRNLQPADKEKFGTLQAAHVYFVSRLWKDMRTLRPKPRLIFCPTIFCTADAYQNPDYVNAIGEGLDREIMIFWTGPDVGSVSITAADAKTFGRWIRRKPFVWDNYPCNHACGWRPLVAPLKNRSADLAGQVSGFMANPMRQWYPSVIPLATIASYLTDPEGYSPENAIEKAIMEFPPDQQTALRLLVQLYGHSFFGDPGYPPQPRPKKPEDAHKMLPKYHALRKLMSGNPALEDLWREVQPAVDQDIALLESRERDRRKQSPLNAHGEDFDGGAADLFGYWQFDRSANYVYATPTSKDRMRVSFWLEAIPEAGAALRLVARDGDLPRKTRIQVTINQQVIMEGDSPFSGENWDSKSFDIPPSALTAGENLLLIRNMETDGVLGAPPFFMVTEAELVPKPTVHKR